MADHDYGDAPVQAKFQERMLAAAHTLDTMFNGDKRGTDRAVGFVLLVFDFGLPDGDARCNYISNGARREDVVALLKEQVARFEGMPAGEGHA